MSRPQLTQWLQGDAACKFTALECWLRNTVATLVQFGSVALSSPTLCDPMNCSTPGLPVHHQLPELAQTHVY